MGQPPRPGIHWLLVNKPSRQDLDFRYYRGQKLLIGLIVSASLWATTIGLASDDKRMTNPAKIIVVMIDPNPVTICQKHCRLHILRKWVELIRNIQICVWRFSPVFVQVFLVLARSADLNRFCGQILQFYSEAIKEIWVLPKTAPIVVISGSEC